MLTCFRFFWETKSCQPVDTSRQEKWNHVNVCVAIKWKGLVYTDVNCCTLLTITQICLETDFLGNYLVSISGRTKPCSKLYMPQWIQATVDSLRSDALSIDWCSSSSLRLKLVHVSCVIKVTIVQNQKDFFQADYFILVGINVYHCSRFKDKGWVLSLFIIVRYLFNFVLQNLFGQTKCITLVGKH